MSAKPAAARGASECAEGAAAGRQHDRLGASVAHLRERRVDEVGGDLVRIVLDEEEVKAWELSFPHLFLPDLVEAHITQLGLRPADIGDDRVPFRARFSTEQNHQLVPAYADC